MPKWPRLPFQEGVWEGLLSGRIRRLDYLIFHYSTTACSTLLGWASGRTKIPKAVSLEVPSAEDLDEGFQNSLG